MATERARSGRRPGARPRPARAVGGGRGCRDSGRTGAAGGRGGRRGDGPHPAPCGRASVVRAFDGRRGPVCGPRLSEGSATRATPRGPWGSRGRRRRSAPPGRPPGADDKARRAGAGFVGVPSLERDILVVKADSGRDV